MDADEPGSDREDLIQRARDGNEDALGDVLEQYRDDLREFAKRELDVPLAARIDDSDIVQQTFLSAYKQFSQFKGGSSNEFAAWLRRIHQRNVQDAVRHHVKAEKRGLEREEQAGTAGQTVVDAHATTPSQRIEQDEQTDQLQAAMAALHDDQREAVRLRHLEGYSLARMAEHFGRSKEAVAALLKRGVQNMRKHLRE